MNVLSQLIDAWVVSVATHQSIPTARFFISRKKTLKHNCHFFVYPHSTVIYITRVLQIRYNDIMYILYYKVDEFDLPVKRNQAFVVTQFTKSRERFCDHLLGDEEEQQLLRKELLIKVS